jgi:membrane-bound lytic murein transglycosylase D
LRSGFKLSIPANEITTKQINLLKQNKSYLEKVQKNAEPYIHFILTEAEKRNLPTELALLPIVESAYRPFAYSGGSAAGLWQFVPATGRHFKLKQNWWYDGRRDIVASTQAAFDFLQSLSKRFGGDWELALAAYNCGAGCVSRAIKKNRGKQKPTDFWSLPLPKETRAYVPKLLALSSIVKNPAKAEIKLREIPNKPFFASVDIGSQLDMALAADMAGITTDELYRLNPGMNRWATAPDGPHRLNLPISKADEFKQKLSELEPNQRIHWKRHKIKSGDTVSTIAQQYETTSKLIRQANNLNDNSIRAGKYLVIPTATKSLEHYALTADKRKKGIQNRKRKGNKLIHIVQEGDNFWDLAREYQVNHKKLARWNGMAPKDTLKLNQKLVVWVDDKTLKKHNNKLADIMDVRPPSTRNKVYYRVREGDSLSTISHRFKVKVAEVKKWNNLSSKLLKPGQNIKLFVDASSQSQ